MTSPLNVRPETPADHAAIGKVVAEAFGSPVEADLVERIRESPEYLPDLALVAERDGRIVGHVMVSRATIRHESGERSIAMLSPLAVTPDAQRMGVGRALIEAVTAGADRRDEPYVVLEGSPAYYSASSFEPASRYDVTLPLPDWAPPEAAQLRPLSRFDPNDPTLRGIVVYPVAFDSVE